MGRINHQPQLVSRISSIKSITAWCFSRRLSTWKALWSLKFRPSLIWIQNLLQNGSRNHIVSQNLRYFPFSCHMCFLFFFFEKKKPVFFDAVFFLGEVVVLQTKRLFFSFWFSVLALGVLKNASGRPACPSSTRGELKPHRINGSMLTYKTRWCLWWFSMEMVHLYGSYEFYIWTGFVGGLIQPISVFFLIGPFN